MCNSATSSKEQAIATSSLNRSNVHSRILIGVERSKLSFTDSSSSRRSPVGVIRGICERPYILECFTRIYGDHTDYDDDTLAHFHLDRPPRPTGVPRHFHPPRGGRGV